MLKSTKYILTVLAVVFATSGCYLPLKGKVIDAETNRPIEGAVVLVEWTKTVGIGLTYTKSIKVAEVLSDNEGKFELPGCFCPTANKPDLTIYRKGYVAWNNHVVFPNYEKRLDFKWRASALFKMIPFDDLFSYIDHQSFFDSVVRPYAATNAKSTMIQQYNQAERELVIKERSLKK